MNILILLAAIGVFYYLFMRSSGGNFSTVQKEVTFEEVLHSEYGYIMALVAKLGKSDGEICELEQEFIYLIVEDLSAAFDDKNQALAHLKEIFDEEQDIDDNVAFVTKHLYEVTKKTPQKHAKILEFLTNLAFIDGTLHPKERAILFEISDNLNLNRAILEDFIDGFAAMYTQKSAHSSALSLEQAYALLNLSSNTTQPQLKQAYKKAVKEHHPDVVSGRGGNESDIKQATRKLQEINEAYELIKKSKGF